MKLKQNIFKTPSAHKPTPQGNAGYDNARENIDPHIKTKVVSSMEGTVEKVPVNNSDIVNKAYVDSVIPAAYTDADAVAAVATADDYLKNDGDTATGDYNFDSNTLFIDSTNNRVGIGTASPAVKLDVVGSSNLGADNGSNVTYLGRYSDAYPNAYLQAGLTDINKPVGIIFKVRGAAGTAAEKMILDTNGNLGIGTATPGATLEVAGNIRVGNWNRLEFGDTGTRILGSSTQDYMRFDTSAAE